MSVRYRRASSGWNRGAGIASGTGEGGRGGRGEGRERGGEAEPQVGEGGRRWEEEERARAGGSEERGGGWRAAVEERGGFWRIRRVRGSPSSSRETPPLTEVDGDEME
ncbi:uncharacterized protein A4U43_C03F19430 [Asparagus officinalis]|uniref:Uncharacterized protein n=1 Tax=Asparagus officinalis TaxID=4686 RepID=A0A5P1FGB9_ASPOF|nr:uncharacterized protein A4U43_C03F19430 [Asparagus officinalis]